ncbi:MAG: LAGLIDADG family homing endonuclease [Candidatus Paceibacterota bacterium]
MADISTLKNPNKSHRKQISLPKYSTNLAEFFGIMIGDGGINNPWQANITLNSIKDANYAKYVYDLCDKLFGVTPAIRKRKTRNALVLSLASTSVVDFLVKNGLARGNKLKMGLKIPRWILEQSSYKKACVRGLMDTDGCIFVHTHKVSGKIYKNISLSFTSYSPELVFQVADILAEFKIIPHISKRGRDVTLYQEKAVIEYLKIFGTSNNRIQSVYKKWRDARAV